MAFLQCDFFSDVLGLSCSMNVILPQNTKYQIGMSGVVKQEKFPVLYLLHGYSDDHTIWMRRTSVERYVADAGLAVIMPAVNKSFYTDMYAGDSYWTFVSEELPQIAASFFPISDKREDTFAAGLSMGGYGAFKLALKQPERFAAAGSFSGAVAHHWDKKPNIVEMDERAIKKMQERERIFGDLTSFAGSENDLMCLVKDLAEKGADIPKLYQCCGTEDFLYDQNIKFRDHLKDLNVPLHYEEGPGTHEWGYWDMHIERFIKWLDLK